MDHCNSLRVIAGAPKRAAVAHNGIDAWAVGQVGVRQEPTHPSHIRTGTGPTPPTSAPGMGSPRSHLHRDGAHPAHICTRTGLTPLTSAPGLGAPRSHLHRHLGSALPHRHRDLSSVPCCCAAAARAPSTGPATRRGAQRPHLFAYIQRRLWHTIASPRADTKVSAAAAAAGHPDARPRMRPHAKPWWRQRAIELMPTWALMPLRPMWCTSALRCGMPCGMFGPCFCAPRGWVSSSGRARPCSAIVVRCEWRAVWTDCKVPCATGRPCRAVPRRAVPWAQEEDGGLCS